MAKIIPYGDPNAHGSMADSVSFRRRGATVIFQKKPFPKQPNTQAQLDQREAFKDACLAWQQYDTQSKTYFENRGSQLNMSGRNLFISAYLKNILPSTQPLEPYSINTCQLSQVYGTEAEQVTFQFGNYADTKIFMDIHDPENVYNKGEDALGDAVILYTWATAGYPITYPFRYYLTILCDQSITPYYLTLRFPEFTTGEDPAYNSFYIASDGSLYSDSDLTHLLATNNF